MMYGFGDAANPNKETIDLMEELLVDYIAEIVRSPCNPHQHLR